MCFLCFVFLLSLLFLFCLNVALSFTFSLFDCFAFYFIFGYICGLFVCFFASLLHLCLLWSFLFYVLLVRVFLFVSVCLCYCSFIMFCKRCSVVSCFLLILCVVFLFFPFPPLYFRRMRELHIFVLQKKLRNKQTNKQEKGSKSK